LMFLWVLGPVLAFVLISLYILASVVDLLITH